jgi:hypothetical protein
MAIYHKLSGGAANANHAASIGGAISSVAAPASIFGSLNSASFTGGSTRYRCIYVLTDQSLDDVKAWISSETPSANTTVALGWGSSAAAGTEPTIANEFTAPAGVTFSAPSSEATAINGGDIDAADWRALWIRYTITATTPITFEQFSITTTGTLREEATELWVDPAASQTGDGSHMIYSAGTYTINRDAGGQGYFLSDATLTGGTDYVLSFDFPNTGGTHPDYAIDIRTVTLGTTVVLELSAASGPHSYPFTMPETDQLLFTLPDVDWSAVYANISLTVNEMPTSASNIGQEELDSGVVSAVALTGLQPFPVPFDSAATWTATNVQRKIGGGMEGTAATLCHAYIDVGDPLGINHTFQFNGVTNSTRVETMWCLTGDPNSGTGYGARISRASTAVAWDVSFQKLGTGALTASKVKRLNATTLVPDAATTLTGIIPAAEVRVHMRVGTNAAGKRYFAIDWGASESIYLETSDTAYSGTGAGFATLTPSGSRPVIQTRMGMPYFAEIRPPRLTSWTTVTLTPTSNLDSYPGQLSNSGSELTGPGDVHDISVTTDLLVKCNGKLTKPVFIYAEGSHVVTEGFDMELETQPGNGAGELEMNNFAPSIGARLPYAGGAVRVDNPKTFFNSGSTIDCTGHRGDCFIIRGGEEDSNDAYLTNNRKIIFALSSYIG